MQAIKYAAMASRFTVEALVGRYIEFAARQGHSVVPEEALDELQEHAGRELADDGSNLLGSCSRRKDSE